MITIPIQPYKIGSTKEPKTGTQFEVRYVNYSGPSALADCHLLDEKGIEILPVGVVPVTAEQCEKWTDDNAFAAVIATNAGFEPV